MLHADRAWGFVAQRRARQLIVVTLERDQHHRSRQGPALVFFARRNHVFFLIILLSDCSSS